MVPFESELQRQFQWVQSGCQESVEMNWWNGILEWNTGMTNSNQSPLKMMVIAANATFELLARHCHMI